MTIISDFTEGLTYLVVGLVGIGKTLDVLRQLGWIEQKFPDTDPRSRVWIYQRNEAIKTLMSEQIRDVRANQDHMLSLLQQIRESSLIMNQQLQDLRKNGH